MRELLSRSFKNSRSKALARRPEHLYSSQHPSPPQLAFASSPVQATQCSRDSPIRPRAPPPGLRKPVGFPPPPDLHGSPERAERCSHKPQAPFLSECDVGASKAVVNGLALGSNGRDKGKALEGKPGISRRSRAWATRLVGTVTDLIRL